MRKFFTYFILLFFLVQFSVLAQTKEATPSAQDSAVQKLKDKLASKVAELQKKDQKGLSGIVAENKNNKITFKGEDNTTYETKIDDVLTKLYDIATGAKKELEVSDIEKGDFIIVSGPVSGHVVTANYIYRDERFILGSGKITEVNATNLFLKVLTTDKETVTLDVGSTAKKLLADVKELTADAVTFAKLKEGDTIHFVVKTTGNEREKNRYAATKILVIPQEYFQK